jgi:hypothetical protein
MADVLLSGDILGEANLPPPSWSILHRLVGSANGLASLPSTAYIGHRLQGAILGSADVEGAAPYRSVIVSGNIHGVGTLSLRETNLSGAIIGVGSTTAVLHRSRMLHGHISGTSLVTYAQPMPIICGCNLSAYLEVVRVPAPLSCKSSIRTLRLGQMLQRGDLGIWITQIGKGAISPYRVTYTLYQGLPGCVPKLIGPSDRYPAQGDIGEYYATGIAGDGGQPGRWRIVWRYQLTYGGPVLEEAMCFMIQDAIAAGSPPPTCTRQRGWF